MKNTLPPLHDKHFLSRQIGFSLVEIMVGLVIGLLATLVIMQVFSVFEGQKRTTTGTVDAQINGSIALYSLEHELQMAGYALLPTGVANVADSAIECADPTLIQPSAAAVTSISPIAVVDGAAGASDRITVRYGTSATGGIPLTITAPPVGNSIKVADNLGCEAGIAIIMPSCRVTTAKVEAVTTDITLGEAGIANASDKLICLGQWNEITYAVSATGNLERSGTPTIAGIVNIQAQYGISTAPNSNAVAEWVDAVDGLASGDWGAGMTTAGRNRIKALRVAVVARNGLLEKTNVSRACGSAVSSAAEVCAWNDQPANPNVTDSVDSAAPALTLTDDADGTSWQRYRYRVFETIIPLRNVIWSKSTL
jgi:type IV pilus assembly protein PilW